MFDKISRAYNSGGVTAVWRRAYKKCQDVVNSILCIGYLDRLCYKYSIHNLEGHKNNESSLDDILNTVYTYKGLGRYSSIKPQQMYSEIKTLAESVGKRNPETVVEIGTARGGSLYIWNRYLDTLKVCISIDFSLSDERIQFYDQFNEDVVCRFLRKDSQDEETSKEVSTLVNGGIDFLFIDGAGSYSDVKADFLNYRDDMSDNGIIAFHDIGYRPDYDNSSVKLFWDEIEGEHDTEEVFGSPYKTYKGEDVYLGIGMVYL